MRIIVDAMGGDVEYLTQVEGAAMAANNLDVDIVLVGREDKIVEELRKYSYPKDRISIVSADDRITNNDEPAKAIRQKKNASIVVAAKLLNEGGGDALVSAGATGGVLAAGMLLVGRIKGVSRPALAPLIPTDKGGSLLLDAGANANSKPHNLLQYGIMGSVYMNKVMGIKNPKVAIVNIGSEEHKGNDLTKAAYELLKGAKSINFCGSIEGREIPGGNADVIVCDGFTGNVILKLIEGVALTLFDNIKRIFKKNMFTMAAALMVKGGLKEFKAKMDYTEHGGALLLGTKSPVIKAHGASDAKAIYSAIRQAKKIVKADVINKIIDDIKDIKEAGNGD